MRNSCEIRPLSPTRREAWLGLLAALIACVGLRLLIIHESNLIAKDGIRYLTMAKQWSAGPVDVIRRNDFHVGYSVAVVGVHNLLTSVGFPDGLRLWEVAGEAVSLLSAVAATMALWLFAGMTFDWRVAWVGTLIFSVTRHWAVLGADVLSDSLALAFQLWGVVLALVALRQLYAKRWRVIALAGCVGLCAGLGYLVRPESIIVAILAIGLWLVYQVRDRMNWRLTACAAATVLVTAAACMAPYVAIIGRLTKKKHLGDFAISTSSGLHAASVAGNFDAVVAVLDKLARAMHPALVVMAGIWIVVAIVSSTRRDHPIARLVARPNWPGLLLILATGAMFLTMMSRMYQNVHYVSSRHLALMAALLAPLAGAGAVFVGNMIGTVGATRPPARWRIALVGLGLAALVTFTFVNARKPLHTNGLPAREAGLYLAGVCKPDDFIVSCNPWVCYYTQRPSREIRVQKGFRLDDVIWLLAVQNPGAAYLVLDEDALLHADPNLKDDLHPPQFELVKVLSLNGQKKDQVYLYRTHVQPAATAPYKQPNSP